ncbi:MAG: hypothetical protein HKN17_04240, partial [Rhodothermales bacterium]|nr:hypothetical protein [Rhodothermales bacterium]
MATATYELAQAIRDESRLETLHRMLTFGASSAGFLWVLFWLPYGPVLSLMLIGAVAFTPYLVLTLFRLRKTGWLIAYGILVFLPVLFAALTGTAHLLSLLPGAGSIGQAPIRGYGGFLLWIWPLVGFYICTFVLRHSVGHWLEEARWTRKDLEQIERRA